MKEHDIRTRIYELRGYIASNWPDIDERRDLYREIAGLEKLLEELKREEVPGVAEGESPGVD